MVDLRTSVATLRECAEAKSRALSWAGEWETRDGFLDAIADFAEAVESRLADEPEGPPALVR